MVEAELANGGRAYILQARAQAADNMERIAAIIAASYANTVEPETPACNA